MNNETFNQKYSIDYTIIPKIDYDKETIELIEVFQNKLSKSVIDTKNQAIRESLIKLGWIPPK